MKRQKTYLGEPPEVWIGMAGAIVVFAVAFIGWFHLGSYTLGRGAEVAKYEYGYLIGMGSGVTIMYVAPKVAEKLAGYSAQ